MYNAIVSKFVEAQKVAEAAYQTAVDFERAQLPGLESHLYSAQVRSGYSTARELSSFCEHVAGCILMRASKEFAPPGACLKLDASEERKRAGLDISNALDRGTIPDLDAYWDSLRRQYDAGGGAMAAYQQAAQTMIRCFGLARKTEVQRTASAVVLRKGATSEAAPGGRGTRRLGFYSYEHTAQCLQALATFAGTVGNDLLIRQLSAISVYQIEYNYREKRQMSGLDIVFFKDQWEFRLSHQLADDLMLFIGEHGAAFLAERE